MIRAKQSLLPLAAIVLVLARGGEQVAQAAGRPNILFIYTDDQPYKTVGCYPDAPRWAKTPNIDRLAETGVRFERAYCGSWCMPSRASILTGRLPHGIESMHMSGQYPGSSYDPRQCPFWPAVFRSAGYHTAQIGKWHTGTDTGWQRDWDYQIVWNRPAHPENAGNYYKDQILAFNGKEQRTGGYSTDNYTRWAEEYIRGEHRDPEKPWLLWLCYGAVHGPTTPADRHRRTYAGREAPVPADIFGPRPDKPSYLDRTQAWIAGPEGHPHMKGRKPAKNDFDTNAAGKSFQAWVEQVNECTRAIDEGVGKLMAALAESGQLASTLVIYTADQGFALGEHGLHQKMAPYDAAIASPLVISRPGTIPQGRVCEQPASSVDLVATISASAGIPIPWKIHGRDLTPLLADPDRTDWTTPLLMEHTNQSFGRDTRDIRPPPGASGAAATPWWVLLRDGRYKYIRTLVAGEPEELYDLELDPEELHNLAAEPKHRQRLQSLREKMLAELHRTDAPFVDNMPPTKAMSKPDE